jgi:hypothetical protein
MDNHKENDRQNKKSRRLSQRAQLRQQQKTIENLNLKLKDYLNAISMHYRQVLELKKELEKERSSKK